MTSRMTSHTSHNELIDRYIAAWNEVDSQRRKDLIERTWTEDSTISTQWCREWDEAESKR